MSIVGRNDVRSMGTLLAMAAVLFTGARAEAAGFERTQAGARANGRAGADYVGGDSPMSLFYNPANLIVGNQTVRLEGALHLHFSERCMTHLPVTETFDDDDNVTGRSAGTPDPTICSEGGVGTIPELAASFRVSDKLALGFGVFVPPAATRAFSLGNPDTVRYPNDADGDGEDDLTPTRFLLVQQELLQLFLTVGVAYAPNDRFRIGGSFGWGMTKVDYASASFSRVPVTALGIQLLTAEANARTALSGFDGFLPRIQLGAWAQPFEGIGLETGATFQWTQDVRVGDAELNIRTVDTYIPPPFDALVGGDIAAENTISGVGLHAPQTSSLAWGIRYAHKLPEPVDNIGDRLSTERFDVELDLVATFARRMTQFEITPPADAQLNIESPIPGVVDDIVAELPDRIVMQKRWRSQLAVRVGGDVSIVPGLLAVRTGFHYETHGVQRGYELLDFQPFQQFGWHVGGTLRLFHRVDLSIAYAHIWQPTVTLDENEAQYRRIAAGAPEPGDSTIENAGTFTGHSNILILQVGASFGDRSPRVVPGESDFEDEEPTLPPGPEDPSAAPAESLDSMGPEETPEWE